MTNRLYVNARFLTQPITGVQRYGIEISQELKNMDSSIVFLSPQNILHEDLANKLGAIRFGRFSGHLWEQYELPQYLKHCDAALLINFGSTAPLFYSNKISTIHDVAFERYPKSFSWQFRSFYKFLIPRVARSSRIIITVSQFSKAELCGLYSLDSSKVEVIYNATSSFFRRVHKKSDEPYILAVSSLSYQKNFHRLIDAFIALKDQVHKLYLVGGVNRNFADTELIRKIDSNPRIKLLGRVSDDQLVDLYSNAAIFVYPSLYEGFGIPPLEAQACGCPVIVSRAASLTEVCQNSVLYCSAHDVSDIANKIDTLLGRPDIREKLIEDGYKNINRFSWKNSASKLFEIIKRFQ